MVARAVQVKVNVVQRDPYEQNVRAYLNFGHTFAHAIEQVSGYQWLHGEAVGVGLVAAARLSAALGMIDADLADANRSDRRALWLPTRIGDLDPEHALRGDGDRQEVAGRTFALHPAGRLRQADDRPDVPAEQVIEVLVDLRGA